MHGGDIYSSVVKYDFSVNINPLGVPESVKQAYFSGMNTVSAYPDPACITLRSRLASQLCTCGNANVGSDNILCGNGASELIPAVLRAAKVKKALLVAPGFTGYKRALDSVEAETEYFFLKEEQDFEFGSSNLEGFLQLLEEKSPDAVILTNPNNPNGALIQRNVVERVAKACSLHNALLMVDECFIELSEKGFSHSFVPLVKEYPDVVVLRAFTKTFAVPGLRLGYIICSDEKFVKGVEKQLPEWNVSTISQICGEACLQETEYVKRARGVIQQNLENLKPKLKALGFKVYSTDCNFILFKSKVTDLKERLLEKGILIRDCRDFAGLGQGFYRVAVKTQEENQILLAALAECV